MLVCAALAACAVSPEPAPQSGSMEASPSDPWKPQGEHYGRTGHRQFSAPVSQPVTFESPVVDTSVRPVFMWHEFPGDSIFQGGDLLLYALQIRVAITDRLGFIATKDGWIDLNPDGGPIPADEGWADLAGGLKYAFIDDTRQNLLLSGGLIFEFASGDEEVLQGNGDGVLRPFISVAKEFDEVDLMGSIGFSQPIDTDAESSSLDYHAQVSYEVDSQLVPFVAFHGISYTKSGNTTPVNFEGVDLVNLGATMVAGNTVFSGGVGARYRFTPDISVGAAYDFPIGGRDDILDQRVTVDAIFNF